MLLGIQKESCWAGGGTEEETEEESQVQSQVNNSGGPRGQDRDGNGGEEREGHLGILEGDVKLPTNVRVQADLFPRTSRRLWRRRPAAR